MKFVYILITSIFIFQNSNAQYSSLYQHYYTPVSGQALTVIKENNVAFDAQDNIYTMMDRESARYSIMTKLNTSGTVAWIDTLKLPNLAQSAYGDMIVKNQNIYTLASYGNNLNSSIIEAMALTKFDLNGAQTNQVLFNASNTSYLAKKVLYTNNNSILISYITNNLQQNWTVHVECYDTNFNFKWNQTFAWPAYSPSTTPMALDNQSNCFLTYTVDSVVSGNYYRKAFVHKIDSSGNLQWSKTVNGKRYLAMKVNMANELILAGETIAPLVYVSNNIGDVLIAKFNSSNGNQIWETPYTAAANEKAILYSLDVDSNDRILIGGLQDIQDVTTAHYKGYVNMYNTNGSILKNIILSTLDETKAARFGSLSQIIVRSSTSTVLYVREYNIAGNLSNSMSFNFANGASWSSMDLDANDDLAVAVSDVLCADRGVTVMRLSKKPNAVSDISSLNNINIYPNPSKDKLMIQTTETIESIFISDLNGKKITATYSQSNGLDISSLSNGLYFLHVETSKGNYNTKFTKE